MADVGAWSDVLKESGLLRFMERRLSCCEEVGGHRVDGLNLWEWKGTLEELSAEDLRVGYGFDNEKVSAELHGRFDGNIRALGSQE